MPYNRHIYFRAAEDAKVTGGKELPSVGKVLRTVRLEQSLRQKVPVYWQT